MKKLIFSVAVAMVITGASFATSAQARAEVQFGYMQNNKFYYASNKGIWQNHQECNAFFKRIGGCGRYKACGEMVYYPGLNKLIQDHLRSGRNKAVKIKTNRTNCLIRLK